jgi:hypothetical protein
MITKASIARRVTALALLFAASAMSMASAQTVDPAHRWDAWVGCWSATPSSGTPLSEISAMVSLPRICVTRVNAGVAAEIATVDSGKVISRDTIVVDGADHPISLQGCSGTKKAQWSADGERIFMQSHITCPGDLKRNTTQILAITPSGEWLDVQTASSGTNTGVRVTRYRDAGASTAEVGNIPLSGSMLALGTARATAGGTLDVADIAEATRLADTAAVQAWIVERGVRFNLSARQLVALADAGVPGSVTDVMIGVSYPEHFAMAQPRAASSADGYSLLDDDRARSDYIRDRCVGSTGSEIGYLIGFFDPCAFRYRYGYGIYGPNVYRYSPFGYDYLYPGYGYRYGGYGSYGGYYGGYSGAPIVVVRGEETPHGTLVKGGGYKPGSSSSSGGGERSSGGSSSSSGSGSPSTSGSAGSSSSSGSSGSSGAASSGGRTAKPRPPQ